MSSDFGFSFCIVIHAVAGTVSKNECRESAVVQLLLLLCSCSGLQNYYIGGINLANNISNISKRKQTSTNGRLTSAY